MSVINPDNSDAASGLGVEDLNTDDAAAHRPRRVEGVAQPGNLREASGALFDVPARDTVL